MHGVLDVAPHGAAADVHHGDETVGPGEEGPLLDPLVESHAQMMNTEFWVMRATWSGTMFPKSLGSTSFPFEAVQGT